MTTQQELLLLLLDIDPVRDFVKNRFDEYREFETITKLDDLEIVAMPLYTNKLFYRITGSEFQIIRNKGQGIKNE